MHILLTNDDGIRAPGIVALFEALTDAHGTLGGPIRVPGHDTRTHVLPIAPLTVQSATGHGVTFHEPLMTSPAKVNQHMEGIAVDGRPADCVKLALSELWPERFGAGSRPHLLISGLNAGANCGINVIYSGTVAAALEAAFLGVPSIAVSLHLESSAPRFDIAARHARRAIEAVLADGLIQPHTCISINIPVTEADGPTPPIVVAPMNTHSHVDRYDRRVSPAGDVYFWAAGHGLDFHGTEDGSDVQELFNRNITVTPLRYDLTDHDALDAWRTRLARSRPR